LKQSRNNASSNCLTLNISQIITFDRDIYNILEERAPTKIQNHVGWVCQIERNINNNTNSKSSNSSIWSVGASGQFNRNVAAKVIIESKLGNNNNNNDKNKNNKDTDSMYS